MHLSNQEVKIIHQIRMMKTGKVVVIKRDSVVLGVYSHQDGGNSVDKSEKDK